MAKINKALDYNKLLSQQKQGKLLKKHLSFPMFGGIKWDGNYVVIIKEAQGLITYITSGGHIYTHTDPTVFEEAFVLSGYAYFAERIGTNGKLGDRVRCNLRGSRGVQTSTGHKYKVHDMVSIDDYEAGKTSKEYYLRRIGVRDIFDRTMSWARDTPIETAQDLEDYLANVVNLGYEGVMLKDPNWLWEHTKSRKVTCVKYKKRPTADLLVVGVNEGTGKYEGLIGSLTLTDKVGRLVDVGSGMSDEDRHRGVSHFYDKVVEVFYEQIIDTYIQPTFGDEYEGVLIRDDKTREDID